jgi:hypothetical protein
MNRKMIILAIVAIALATLACSININLPPTQTKTGPTQTENINVPLLSNTQAVADVTLKFGAGNLTLQPGATTDLISGTAKYNVADFKPVVTVDNNNITIDQGNPTLNGIPTFNSPVINDWSLSLANAPMSLVIQAGAYKGEYELGGLSLHTLEVTDGAAKATLSFSKPNLVEMTSMQYTTGASEVTIKGLANAYTTDLTFRSGAGNYTLDFSGELRTNMTVTVESGVSQVTIIVPQGVNAQVIAETGLMSVNAGSGWQQNGSTYSLAGTGNTITMHVKMGAGNLVLQTSTPSSQ